MTGARDKAYLSLLERIQRGSLAPGHFLVETDLALELGLSRTPIREAIRQLAAEGLVQLENRRRAVVRDFSEARIDELFELRARLEGYGAHRAATRLDAAALARLISLAERMEDCALLGTPESLQRFADLNDHFHQCIMDGAAAEHLTAALRPVLQIQLLLLQRYRHTIGEHLQRSCWHHRELIRAFELRDPHMAEQQMQLHMLAARSPARGSPLPPSSDPHSRH